MQKIAGWAQQYKQWGNLIVQTDLTSAAFPWAVIQFLLRAETGDVQEFGARSYQLELIARLITKCYEFSSQYLNDTNPVAFEALEKGLTQLYAEILTQLGRMVNVFGGNPLGMFTFSPTTLRSDFGTRTWNFNKATIVPLLKSPERGQKDVEFSENIVITATKALRLVNWSESEALTFFKPQVIRLCDQSSQSWQILTEEPHKKLLNWLSPLPYHQHHQFVSHWRAPGFGKWLLNDPRYKAWHTASSSSILTLRGVVGCGKTTLCSVIVDDLIVTGMTTPAAAPFAYVYCANNENEPGRSSPDELMRTILAQLAFCRADTTKIHNVVWSAYERRLALAQVDKLSLERLKSEDCVQLLLELAEQEPLAIVIDGIDDIKAEHNRIILDALRSIVANSGNVVKVLVSSNHDLSSPVPKETINITGRDVRQDMESFIHHQLDAKLAARWADSSAWSESRSELQQALVENAGERFLSAKLQIERLSRGATEEDIQLMSKTGLSMELNGIYKYMVESLLDLKYTGHTTVITAFSLLLYTKHVLDSSTFSSAVATRAGTLTPQQSVETCFGLIVFDTTCNTFRFIHQSVKDYLANLDVFSCLSGQKLISKLCLEALSRTPPSRCSITPARESIYTYAAAYWPFHVKAIRDDQMDDGLDRKVFSFLFDDSVNNTSPFAAWLDNIQSLVKQLPSGNVLRESLEGVASSKDAVLFLASAFGLDKVLVHVLQSPMELDTSCKNHRGHTPLDLAAAFGHTPSVLALLEHDVETDTKDGRYISALHAACYAGHVDVVDKLLEHGAPAIRSCGNALPNALQAACSGGQEEVVLSLLQDVTILGTTADYEQAVLDAAQAGFVQVLQRLKQAGFHATEGSDLEQDQAKAITKKAIESGHLEVLRWCLSETAAGSDIFAEDAVSSAVLYGHKRVVECLLEQGLSMEAEGKFGSPLVTASLLNHEALVLLLLQHGVEVDANGTFGTALYIAALKAHTGIVQLLTQVGCNVNRKTGLHETSLRAAAYQGHTDTVRLLLGAGASMTAALRAAIDGGHPNIVRLILDQGYREFHPEKQGPDCELTAMPSRYRALLRDASPKRKNIDNTGRACDEVSALPAKPLIELDAIFRADKGTSLLTDSPMLEPRSQTPRSRGYREATLGRSVRLGNKEVVVAVLERACALDIRDEHVVHEAKGAAKQGLASIVEILLTYLATKPSLCSCIKSVLEVAQGQSPDLVEVAFTMANRYCSAEQVNELRTETLPSVQKFKRNQQINSEEVVSEFATACVVGNLDLIKAILESAHVSQLDTGDLSYGFQEAATNGHAAIVELLLNSDGLRKMSKIADDCLIGAATNGHLDVTRLLVAHYKATPRNAKQTRRAFMWSCRNGHIDLVRYFIQELSLDVNKVVLDRRIKDPNTRRRLSKYSYLSGPDPSESFISPLQSSIKGCGPKWADDNNFVEEDLWIDEYGVGTEHEAVIKLLLDNGANPNDLGGLDMYPLQAAAEFCTESSLKLLIEAGADVNLTSSGGSPIFRAAGRELSTAGIMGVLLDAGADLPTSEAEIERLQAQPLEFFVGKITRKTYHQTSEDPDGRFLVTESLDYVFKHGPGAAIRILMSKYPQLSASDERYGLILQMAVCAADHSYVDLLLARGVDVNTVGYYYGTALQAASRYGNHDMVMKLLGAGAKVNVLQGRWQTALRAAIASGNAQVVRTLLSCGANTKLMLKTFRSYYNARETKSPSALQLAVESGKLEIVEALLGAGVDVSGNVSKTATIPQVSIDHHPLILSSERGDLAMVRSLLSAGAPVNVTGKHMPWRVSFEDEYASPLTIAIHTKHADVVEFLLASGANVDKTVNKGCSALMLAARHGDRHVVRLLIEKNANINYTSPQNWNALVLAAEEGHIDIVQDLLSAGAKPDVPNALSSACNKLENGPVVELLLQAVLATENPEPVIDAAFAKVVTKGNAKAICLLLDYIPATTKRFIQCCSIGSEPAVTSLLEQGMSPNQPDDEGNHPLHTAAIHLQSSVVQILLDHGAGVNHISDKYGTPLLATLWACAASRLRGCSELVPKAHLQPTIWTGSREWSIDADFAPPPIESESLDQCEATVDVLLRSGANPDKGTAEHGPPLHPACLTGSEALVQKIIDRRANVNVTGGTLTHALFAALVVRRSNIVALLLEHAADTRLVHPTFGTPLHYAGEISHVDSVRELLKHGADERALDANGKHPVEVALLRWNKREQGWKTDERREELLSLFSLAQGSKSFSEDLLIGNAASGGVKPVLNALDRDKNLVVSERVVCAVFSHDFYVKKADLQALLQRTGGLGVTEMMLKSAQLSRTIKMLLGIRPRCKITLDLLLGIEDLTSVRQLLAEKPKIHVLPRLVVHMLKLDASEPGGGGRSDSNKENSLLEGLWKRNPDLVVTADMLKATRRLVQLEFLLKRFPGTISENVITTVNKDGGLAMTRTLLQHDPSLRISAKLAHELLRYPQYAESLEMMLEERPDVPVTEEMFLTMFGERSIFASEEHRASLVKVLQDHGRTLVFTKRMRAAIDDGYQSHSDVKKRDLVYSLRERDAEEESG
ncbi:ankyrin repeat-containing domain protein [Dactylonectria estremocensis]|uniref:Ankyrin repeat-containing domain protein n=1 Tax=Dactylonectria estremocensis TaxID=1079267 RepID=A0A9P9JBK1_9HYPO|nr:ankyrin repeat-containing domain protein [Dactylonectria estremocensis]